MQHDNRFPDLAEIFGPYFHQDWAYDSGTAEVALSNAIQNSSASSRGSARRQLDELLASKTARDELDNLLWWVIGCEYVPTADGWESTRAWLEHVRDRIDESLHQSE